MGFFGLLPGHRLFFAWFAWAVFFQYFWVIPDEMFKDTLRKCAARAFFANIAVTAASMPVLLLLGFDNFMLAAGWFGLTASVCTFAFSLTFFENKERRGVSRD